MERAPGIVVSERKVLCTLAGSTDTKSQLRQKSLCGDGSQKARYSGEAGGGACGTWSLSLPSRGRSSVAANVKTRLEFVLLAGRE